jgi:hypothetical protein
LQSFEGPAEVYDAEPVWILCVTLYDPLLSLLYTKNPPTTGTAITVLLSIEV